ncbi:cupin domain-containing protein [Paenibacillus sp. p3-SID867]|uniref:cupin domain-containing protein n=1 Tax=Paenibacillus sp. p3-SID867 TaxID=2916363 RepID=UPI0021A4EC17|nr:cupin domain-containing protein [Paenibacillus sp. p3-SID867]MCT1399654.1 cupin domain-containing protein [Paenibacillus sp. p3-SID867]
MAVSYMDFTSPSVRYTYDLRNNQTFKKDNQIFIYSLSVKELNTLGNASLLDIHLSTGNVVEPHIHQNASELVYVISGAAIVSMVNPFTKELLNFKVTPGQVALVPQGWWHYEMATVDNTHLIAVFDAPVPEFIAGSDLLRLTPASVLAHTYCLDEDKVKDTLAPITDTVVIGPPKNCPQQGQVQGQMKHQQPASHHNQHYYHQENSGNRDYELLQQQQQQFQQQQLQIQRQQQQQLFQQQFEAQDQPQHGAYAAEPPLSPPHLQEQFRSQKQLQEQQRQLPFLQRQLIGNGWDQF